MIEFAALGGAPPVVRRKRSASQRSASQGGTHRGSSPYMPETFVEEGYYDDWPPTTGVYDAKQEMTRPPTDEEMANPVTAMVPC